MNKLCTAGLDLTLLVALPAMAAPKKPATPISGQLTAEAPAAARYGKLMMEGN